MFPIFAAQMFERRVLHAHREQVAQERQLELLRKLEDRDEATKGDDGDDSSEEEGEDEEDDSDGDGEESGDDSAGEQGGEEEEVCRALSSYVFY